MDSDFGRRYGYEDSNRINERSKELVRQKHFNSSKTVDIQPYIHPIKYYEAPAVHPQVQQHLSPRQNNVVLQPVGQTSLKYIHNSISNNIFNSSCSELSRWIYNRTILPDSSWLSQTLTGVGDIENTDAGFTIQLNVEHFEPKDIKITLSENVLSVLGERIDQDKSHEQTLKRSFSRKYCIQMTGSIKSFVSESGILVIKGSRKTWKETEIDIQIERPHSRNAESSIASPKSIQPSPAGSSKSKASAKAFQECICKAI
uniref:SHSP domain-containing protein n=1 Tax=Ditylenchus dipsaci TaxID=166011 RepID=A0A915DLC7_9BILA